VIKVGDKIQVEIREVDDRGKLSLVPVEVVEREAAGGGQQENAGAPSGRDRGDGNRGDRDDHRGDRDGHRSGDGGSHRTRHRERRHRDS
jgi:polyribonucleotide nucleotidyltransferase